MDRYDAKECRIGSLISFLYRCGVVGGVVERGGRNDVRARERALVVPTPEKVVTKW